MPNLTMAYSEKGKGMEQLHKQCDLKIGFEAYIISVQKNIYLYI